MKTGTYALMTGWLSLAGGAVAAQELQFLPAVTVNENAPGEDGPYSAADDAAMAVDSRGNLHVVWVGVRAGIRDVYYARSADGGGTFEANIKVNGADSPVFPRYPAIAADGTGGAHIAWQVTVRRGTTPFCDTYYAQKGGFQAAFGPAVRVNDGDERAWNNASVRPAIAVDGRGGIHVIRSGYPVNAASVLYAKSMDGGASFGASVKVDKATDSVYMGGVTPSLAVEASGDDIHVVYAGRVFDPQVGTTGKLLYAESRDGGRTFGGNLPVDNSSPYNQLYPSIAVDGLGDLHLGWLDHADHVKPRQVAYARKAKGAPSFDGKVNIARVVNPNSFTRPPSMGVDGNQTLYIAWEENSYPFYAKKPREQAAFTPAARLAPGSPPAIAVDGRGVIHAVMPWLFSGRGIFYVNSADQGASWSIAKRIDDSGAGTSDQYEPRLTIDKEGQVHSVWTDLRGGRGNIFYAKSADGGATFEKNLRVNTKDAKMAGHRPDLAVDAGGNVHAVWAELDDIELGANIFYARLLRGAAAFEPDFKLGNSPSRGAKEPSIAADAGGNIHVTWTEGDGIFAKIPYVKSADKGLSFSTTSIRVDTPDPELVRKLQPALAVDTAGNPHVAWLDGRDLYRYPNDPQHVYYAQSSDQGRSFGPMVKVDGHGPGGGNLDLAVDGRDNAQLAYSVSYGRGIFHAKKAKGSPTFEAGKQVSSLPASYANYFPSIAADSDGGSYIVWKAEDFNDRINAFFLAKSADGGATFAPNLKAVDFKGYSRPQIAVDAGGAVHLGWAGVPEGKPWDQDVYYSRTPLQPDITPPTVTILAPQEGAEVAGEVEISVKVEE